MKGLKICAWFLAFCLAVDLAHAVYTATFYSPAQILTFSATAAALAGIIVILIFTDVP